MEMEKKKPVFLCIMTLLVLAASDCTLFERGLSRDAKEYLHARGEAMTIDYDTLSRPIGSLASYLNHSRIFLLGETHGSEFNYQVFFSVLKALHTSLGNVQVISESGYANEMVVNLYLKTGDETYLRYLLNALSGSVSSNDQYSMYLRQVYAYNQSIPETKRLIFRGIDIEHQLEMALFALQLLMPENSAHPQPPCLLQVPELLDPLLEIGFNRKDYPSGCLDRIKAFFSELYQELSRKESEYQTYFGEKFSEFRMIVDGAVTGMQWYAGGCADVALREEHMFRQFQRVFSTLPENTVMTGLFGMNHVYKRSAERTTIAEMLHTRADSPIRGKVAAVHLFYLDSFHLNKNTGASEKIVSDFQDDLEPFAMGKAGIFSLDEEGSPFRDECFLVFKFIRTGSRPTTDYFNLMILIQGSPACTLWNCR